MSDSPTSGDYAYAAAQDNAKALREIEHRLSILEGICRVALTVNTDQVEAAIRQIKAERDAIDKAESERRHNLYLERLPEEKQRMHRMFSQSRLFNFGQN